MFLSVLFVRPSGPLLWFAAPLAILLTAKRFHYLLSASRRPGIFASPILAVLFVSLVPVLPIYIGCDASGAYRPVAMSAGTVCVPRKDAAAFQQVQEFADRHRGEKIAYLSVVPHLYYLTDTAPQVDLVWASPVGTPDEQVAALQRQLVDRSVVWVIYQPRYNWEILPVNSAQRTPDGTWTLEDFLALHYTEQPSDTPLRIFKLLGA
jgi:hypothetical protein